MAYYKMGKDESQDDLIKSFGYGDGCFLCGEPLDDEVVDWMGHQMKGIVLHPKCARRLGQNLIFDSYAPNRKNEFRKFLSDFGDPVLWREF